MTASTYQVLPLPTPTATKSYETLQLEQEQDILTSNGAACKANHGIYILDDDSQKADKFGSSSRTGLFDTVAALNGTKNTRSRIQKGDLKHE